MDTDQPSAEPNPEVEASPPSSPQASAIEEATPLTAPRRDRIVILGRTQSGKTVFLATMYYALWKQPGDMKITAIDGASHKACLEAIQQLRTGNHLAATTGSKYLNLEVSFKGLSRPLVSLDYPGEVFRKAFIDNTDGPDTQELLDHIDRAAAVIALVDPAIVVDNDLTTAMDDNFGMLKALERILTWPGGEDVPVAFVLTKHDLRKQLIKDHGGPGPFVKKHFPQIVSLTRHLNVFCISAVQNKTDQEGPQTDAVDPKSKPYGFLKPMKHLLKSLEVMHAREEQRQQVLRTREEYQRLQIEARNDDIKRRTITVAAYIAFIIFTLVVAFITWTIAK